MINTATERDVRKAELKKTTIHWCLMPPIAKRAPVTMRTTPAMPSAGVMVGWMGSSSCLSTAVALCCAVGVAFEVDEVIVVDVELCAVV